MAKDCQRPKRERKDKDGKGEGDSKKTTSTSTPPASPWRPTATVKAVEVQESGVGDKTDGNESAGSEDIVTGTKGMKELAGALKQLVKKEHQEKKEEQVQALLKKLTRLCVIRVASLQKTGGKGLLDSGATTPVRPSTEDDVRTGLIEVNVDLGDGSVTIMKMNNKGSLMSDEGQIIVPLLHWPRFLGCKIETDEDEMQVWHPDYAWLEIDQSDGTPLVTAEMGLKLIKELEDKADQKNASKTRRVIKVQAKEGNAEDLDAIAMASQETTGTNDSLETLPEQALRSVYEVLSPSRPFNDVKNDAEVAEMFEAVIKKRKAEDIIEEVVMFQRSEGCPVSPKKKGEMLESIRLARISDEIEQNNGGMIMWASEVINQALEEEKDRDWLGDDEIEALQSVIEGTPDRKDKRG